LYDFAIFHLLSSPCWFFQRNFKELGPGLVAIGEREAVHAPGFGVWVNLGRFNKSAVNVKTVSATDANYLPTNARIATATPRLLIYRGIPFARDLSVEESVAPKFFR
jgi:hypothetical protein